METRREAANAEVRINTQEIPDFRRVELAQGALDLVSLAFAVPGAEARYQAWLAGRACRGRTLAEE